MEVFTPGVSTPPFPIVDQNVAMDPIQIKKIDGLGPVTASVNTTQYGSVDGEFLNGTFTPKRNIVLTIGLNPDWANQTFEGLRQILYSYFMPESEVRLRFTSTHMATVEIVGYVESCEPDMFSKDPEYTVSIICPQPYFTAIAATAIQGQTQSFAAPTDVLVNYEGSVDVGFIVDVTLPSGGTAFSGEFRLVNNTPSTQINIVSPIAVSSTQFFRISTVQSSKYARQYPLPSGLPTNILSKVSSGSVWMGLRRRSTNKIQILTATAGLNWTLSYYASYGGL
jgi:hypothetical protein